MTRECTYVSTTSSISQKGGSIHAGGPKLGLVQHSASSPASNYLSSTLVQRFGPVSLDSSLFDAQTLALGAYDGVMDGDFYFPPTNKNIEANITAEIGFSSATLSHSAGKDLYMASEIQQDLIPQIYGNYLSPWEVESSRGMSTAISLVSGPLWNKTLALFELKKMPTIRSRISSSFIISILRSYPRSMIRKCTFPPFIHPQSDGTDGSPDSPLPEPLAVCMNIAELFLNRTRENVSLVWPTIWIEQERIMNNVRLMQSLSPSTPFFSIRS